ncbi:MAG: coenzyme F420-0:L-glutamate ligase, partial [Candidatus Bathyarchaeota archaeon]
MANKYKVVAIETNYWKPKDNYLKQIIQAIENIIEDGDIITISEKAISTALGNLIDEDKIKPTKLAFIIAKYWMRIIWPYFLGPICHLREKTVQNL